MLAKSLYVRHPIPLRTSTPRPWPSCAMSADLRASTRVPYPPAHDWFSCCGKAHKAPERGQPKSVVPTRLSVPTGDPIPSMIGHRIHSADGAADSPAAACATARFGKARAASLCLGEQCLSGSSQECRTVALVPCIDFFSLSGKPFLQGFHLLPNLQRLRDRVSQ